MYRKLLVASSLFLCVSGFAQTVLFNEDFETESARDSWINVDRDGDDQKWEFDNTEVDNFTGYYATSWS